MISRYEVWLNDVALSEIDPSIYVSDINYKATSVKHDTHRLSGKNGQFSGETDYVQDNRITVTFEVREYDTNKRQTIVQNINAWAANGGWLKSSDRIGQRIYVKTTVYPAAYSVLRWTDALTVEFTAFDYPYWQDEFSNTIQLNSGDEGDIFVPGCRKTDVEAVVVPAETMTGFEIECGDTRISLDGISIPANQSVKISYTDDHHILQIVSNNVSLLDKRTADSNDDLMLDPGTGHVHFVCSVSAVCTVSVKGVYL